MASIRKRGKNSYNIRVSNGYDMDGNHKFAEITYRPTATTPKAIEKEVEQFAKDFENRVLSDGFYEGEKIKFSDFVKTWKSDWAESHLSEGQIEQYESSLEMHIIPEIGNILISKINSLQIQNIITRLNKANYSPKTVRRIITSLNSVMKYAYKMNIIETNPVDRCELPRLKQSDDLHFFTANQAKTFIKALDGEYEFSYGKRKRKRTDGTEYSIQEYRAKHKISLMFKVYFVLAIYGGFRRGEMVALTWEDIDFKNNVISINKAATELKGKQIIKDTKTKSGRRDLVMPQVCFDLLSEWKIKEKDICASCGEDWVGKPYSDFDKNWIFIQKNGKQMDLHTPSHKFKEILDMYSASVQEEDQLPYIRLHDLRHTSASLLLAENVDIETVSVDRGIPMPQ